jgi:glycosyltransferase involved in cell wall biosynthesis
VRVAIDYRPALRERSGVGEYTHQLVKALLAAFPPGTSTNQLELSLFSSSWKDRLVVAPELSGARAIDRRIPVRLLNLAWHRLEWPPLEWLGGGPFDVTHSSHPLLMPSSTAAQVVTIHDLNFLSHPERTRAEIRRDYATLAREHANRADRVIVSSAFARDEVERVLGVPADRIALCPAGSPGWPPRQAPPRNGYVLFFGTLEPRKNIGGLLDAYERLLAGAPKGAPHDRNDTTPYDRTDETTSVGRPFRGAGPYVERPFRAAEAHRIPELVLAGRATDSARPWLERIERPPLKGRVRHIGYVDSSMRQALYEGARLLVQPSFEEGFGLPVLEAMSLGVPIVAARRGSLPEVVGDAGPLVDPERPDDIAAAIAQLLADDDYAAACAAKGLARARAFSWERTAHLVLDVYRQAIAQRARGGPRH